MIAVAILGHGVVGSGVAEVLETNRESISRKAGTDIYVKRILDVRDFSALPYAHKFTNDFESILADPEIKVVVEAMGGLSPAYNFVSGALKAGKSVVTSNKELVAAKGAELLALARKMNINFLFEASVGGGVPIIRPLHQCLAANEIDEIVGILNGTTNFILTKMIREGMSFDQALGIAQELGYAEKDPTADVEGHDTCRKICILASLVFGEHISPENVPTTGITKITPEDVHYGESAGKVIKLLGQTSKVDGKCMVSVEPAFISRESPLAMVEDVFNGILVRGNATGDVVFYGKGAGKLPTASAVVSDIIDCVTAGHTITSLHWSESSGGNVADIKSQPCVRYIRCEAEGMQPDIACVFGEVTPLHRPGKPANECAFITSALNGYEMDGKLAKLRANGAKILGNIQVWER